jgi:hypothetical protein
VPVLIGFILGVVLTIAGAYEFDSSTGRAANGLSPTAAGGQPPMVNWNVVSEDWQSLQASVRNMGAGFEKSLKGHTG